MLLFSQDGRITDVAQFTMEVSGSHPQGPCRQQTAGAPVVGSNVVANMLTRCVFTHSKLHVITLTVLMVCSCYSCLPAQQDYDAVKKE